MAAHNFDDLIRHVGHNVSVVTYGDTFVGDKGEGRMSRVWNVAVECEDCHEVLIDFDHPENK